MARGYIFEVSDSIDELGTISEDDYYGRLGELAVDYVEDRKGEARDAAIDTALGTMKNKGMETGSKDIGGVIWKWFIPTKSCLKRMSEEALGDFRKHAAGLTAEDFAEDSYKLFETRQALKNTCGDLFIKPDGCEYPFLQWIANLPDEKFGEKFYFGNVVLMH